MFDRRICSLVVAALLVFGLSAVDTQTVSGETTSPTFGEDAGEDYVTFWSGELRIIPQTSADTEVEIINLRNGNRLDFANNSKVGSVSPSSNPMTLSGPEDYFSGIGGLGDPTDELQVRIRSTAPVTVWTGSTLDDSGNAWASLMPTTLESDASFGRELGTDFLGFTSESLIMIAERESTTTTVDITDHSASSTRQLTFDGSIPDCPEKANDSSPAYAPENTPCYLHNGSDVQAVYANGYCDSCNGTYDADSILELSSNNPMSALTARQLHRSVGNNVAEVSRSVQFDTEFDDTPLLFSQVQTQNSTEAAQTTKATDVTTDGATIEFCEQETTDSCDSDFPGETIGWLAIDPQTATDSGRLDAGTVTTSGSSWESVSFSESFDSAPVVLVDVQSTQGGQEALYAEAKSVDADGADIRFCESDGGDGCDGHNTTTIAWLAIEQGAFQNPTSTSADHAWQAGLRFSLSGDGWINQPLTASFSEKPHVFATTQTTDGSSDPSAEDLQNVELDNFDIRHCEYDNPDSCDPDHPEEAVGWLAADPAALNQMSGVETGAFAFDRRPMVQTGEPTHANADQTFTPPSVASGDRGQEHGTEFYTYVREQLTIFPTENDTHVEITDLSDGDDSTSVTLENGSPTGSELTLYTPFRDARGGTKMLPSTSNPAVDVKTNGGNPFDSDIVHVQSDKPVLLYQGPAQSDVNEFADVAFSVPIGDLERVTYVYAQNYGNSNDLQLFSFVRNTEVTITSLTTTGNFKGSNHHDFGIDFDVSPGTKPNVTPDPSHSHYTTFGAPGDIQWFGSGSWGGELLRIHSTKPVTAINGDYDSDHFGSYVPFVAAEPPWNPVAKVSADIDLTRTDLCPGQTIEFDGSGSFDQDTVGTPPQIERYDWDFGDGTSAVDAGPNVEHTYTQGGSYTATLTITDNDGQTDTNSVEFAILPASDPTCAGNEPPEAVCDSVTLKPADMCEACASVDQLDGGSFDPDGDELFFEIANGCLDATGETTATLTVTDGKGGSDTCSADVTLMDESAPELSCPADQTLLLGQGCSVSETLVAEGSDNCAGEVSDSHRVNAEAPMSTYLDFEVSDNASRTADADNVAQCRTRISIEDQSAPDASCPVAEDEVVLSPDTCEATRSYEATADDNCAGTLSETHTYDFNSPNSKSKTYTLDDGYGNASTCDQSVTAVDETPPTVSVGTPETEIWPPNHSCGTYDIMQACDIEISDNCSSTSAGLEGEVSRVTSDEPFEVGRGGDGNHTDDIEIVDSETVKLRAERQGGADGRIYTVTVEATDASGNTGTGTCQFIVPHDQSPHHEPVDSGVSETCTGDSGCTCAPKPDDDGDGGDNGGDDKGGGPGNGNGGGPPGHGDDSGDKSDGPKAISFAAFCTAKNNYAAEDVEITSTGTNADQEATSISWESGTKLSTVVLKAGTAITNHEGGTSGEAISGQGQKAGSDQSPSEPCPAGEKLIRKNEDVSP